MFRQAKSTVLKCACDSAHLSLAPDGILLSSESLSDTALARCLCNCSGRRSETRGTLRVGTLNAILFAVAAHKGVTREDVLKDV
jgi:hypothetical protein